MDMVLTSSMETTTTTITSTVDNGEVTGTREPPAVPDSRELVQEFFHTEDTETMTTFMTESPEETTTDHPRDTTTTMLTSVMFMIPQTTAGTDHNTTEHYALK